MNEEGGVRGTEKSISTVMRFSTVILDRSLKHFGLIFFQTNQYTIERKGIRIIKNERRRENSGGTSRVTCKQEDKTREGGPSKRREVWPTFVKAISRRVLKTQNSYKCCLMDNYFCQYKFIFSWSGTKTHQICLLLIMAVSQSYSGENVA